MTVHAERRRRLLESAGDGLLLVRGAGPQGASANLRYLTGLTEPRAVLLLAAQGVRVMSGRRYPGRDYVGGRTVREALFLPRRDELAARWGEGSAASADDTRAEDLGVDVVLGLDELEPVLAPALLAVRRLSYVRAALPTLAAGPDPDVRFVQRLRRRFFGLQIVDATALVHEQRRIKDAGEIAAIERAAALTAAALERLLARLRPGAGESELEAELTSHYRSAGAAHAFDPIVAAGRNALCLHYTDNAGALSAGELLLVDTGARLDGYCSDVTRSVPVDWRFSPRQRQVYETVLEAQRRAIELCRPGATLAGIHAAAFDSIERAGFGAGFPHGIGHHLGLETHDAGDVHLPLEPGCVITVEPGIYLPDEGLGVRIEDDIAITDGPPRVLTAAIPSAVEALARRPG